MRATATELSVERARLDADEQIPRGHLRSLALGAACSDGLASLFALVLQVRLARVQLAQREQAAIELARGRAPTLPGHADFACDLRALFFEPATTQRGFLRAGAHGFELRQQIRMLAVRALNAGLRAVTLRFGVPERLANRAESASPASALSLPQRRSPRATPSDDARAR